MTIVEAKKLKEEALETTIKMLSNSLKKSSRRIAEDENSFVRGTDLSVAKLLFALLDGIIEGEDGKKSAKKAAPNRTRPSPPRDPNFYHRPGSILHQAPIFITSALAPPFSLGVVAPNSQDSQKLSAAESAKRHEEWDDFLRLLVFCIRSNDAPQAKLIRALAEQQFPEADFSIILKELGEAGKLELFSKAASKPKVA